MLENFHTLTETSILSEFYLKRYCTGRLSHCSSMISDENACLIDEFRISSNRECKKKNHAGLT